MPPPPLRLEIVVSRPAGPQVVRAYEAGDPRATAFYGGHFAALDAYLDKASDVNTRFDREARRRAAAALTVPPEGDAERLRRFVDEGGYMVTTGQQPSLFGGPLYNLYKGVTALGLARLLETRLGKPVLPVFWVASEDHDWAEANHTFVVGVDNELHAPSLEAPDPAHPQALHRVPMGPAVLAVLEGFLAHLPRTDFSPPWEDLLREAVTPEATLADAFSRILQGLLGRYGLFFTDAANPVLKSASSQLLAEELERGAEFEAVLSRTSARLQAAGFGIQVPVLEGGLNLFLEGSGGRERLFRDDGAYRLRSSGERLTLAEVRARAAADPRALSPNVLLRPVVENAVFPTLAYVAGPGEMAYYAQLADYFLAHGMRMPVVHPRFGATVVEGKVRKVLEKFGLDVEDLARPFHVLAGEVTREEVPLPVRDALHGLRSALRRGVAELQEAVQAVDPTLSGTVQHVQRQAGTALEELERKVVAALKRENEIALAQLEKAQTHLFPLGRPQERVINPFYFLTRYGAAFLEALLARSEVNIA